MSEVPLRRGHAIRASLAAFALALGLLSPGANAHSLSAHAASPRPLWATTANGIYTSFDGAEHWVAANAGLPLGAGFTGLAVDPSASQTVYTGAGRAVYKTTDGGKSWQKKSTGLRGRVGAIAIDPAHPQIVYASLASGFFRSRDGGEHWQRISRQFVDWPPPFPGTVDTFSDIFVNARKASVIYARGALCAKSTNGGQTWRALGPPPGANVPAELVRRLGRRPYPSVCTALVMDPRHPSVLYEWAGPVGYDSLFRIYKTTNAALTWVSMSKGLPPATVPGQSEAHTVFALALAPKSLESCTQSST